MAALLELGSGFNPEFTGRENVFLNGTLLGLTRQQIEEKFGDIARFAEIGEHMELPVKTYSSGMMLRLAFAVQVAVESPVLIIDEALAVGDARFQLKCFRRLEELKSKGTTILFVSHAIEQVKSFCDFGLVLDRGRAIYWGDAKVAAVKYLATVFPEQQAFTSNMSPPTTTETSTPTQDGPFVLRADPETMETHAFGIGGAKLDSVAIHGGGAPNIFTGGEAIRVECQFSWDSAFIQQLVQNDGYAHNITLGVAIADKKGTYLFGCNGFDKNLTIDCINQQRGTMVFSLTPPHLAEGDYFMSIAIALGNLSHHTQMKWYDCMIPLHFVCPNRRTFGTMAIDYEIELLLQTDKA